MPKSPTKLFAQKDKSEIDKALQPSLARRIVRGAKTLLLSSVAILTITFSTPKLSYARGSGDDLTVLQILGGKTEKSGTAVTEQKPSEAVVAQDDQSNQKLTYVGYGLVAGTVLATLLSKGGDDSKPSKPNAKSTRRAARLDDDKNDFFESGLSSSISDTLNPDKIRSTRLRDGLSKLNPLPGPDELFDAENSALLGSSASIADSTKSTPASSISRSISSTGDRPAPRRRTAFPTLSTENEQLKPEDSKLVDDSQNAPASTSGPMKKTWGVGAGYREQREIDKKTTDAADTLLTPQSKPPSDAFDDDLFSDDLFSDGSKSVTSFSVPETVVPPPAPAPVKKAPGLLGRIFQKPGGNRAIALPEVMEQADAAKSFRHLVGAILGSYLTSDLFPEFKRGGKYQPLLTAPKNEEEQAAAVLRSKDECGLTPQQAADAYAEVASVMLVKLTDSAVAALDAKPPNDNATIAALTYVTDFMYGAEAVFLRNFNGITIEPVLYNGKARKGKLEDLYFKYCKSTMSLDAILDLSGLTGASPSTEAGQAGGEASSADTDGPDKIERLARLQQVFAIKEGKRSSLEQKAMKELFMSGDMGGGGGMGNLGAMMGDLMSGKSAGNAGNMQDMMGGMGGMGGMPPMEGIPDFSKMDPKELEKLSEETLGQVKASLRDGSITKADVVELEKILGMDLRDFAKMMNSQQVDKKQLRAISPELAEITELFQQLSDIKNK